MVGQFSLNADRVCQCPIEESDIEKPFGDIQLNESEVSLMTFFSVSIRPILKYVIVGMFAGVFIIHPLTMVIYWVEFNTPESFDHAFWTFAFERMAKSFTRDMLPMTTLFILLGGGLGLASGMYYQFLARRSRLISGLTDQLSKDLKSLIGKGESETIEFKSSLRWDFEQKTANKALESAVLKTIAGFMNNQGGTLLIGVDDNGTIVGLERDYSTLRRKGRDGLEQALVSAISARLGADLCPITHTVFHEIEGKDVCRVIVEASLRPVYLREHSVEQYFLRAGNTTRELHLREALAHIRQRWPRG